MSLTTGQVLVNRYRIVLILGQGGMGAVYRAWDLNLNKPVALKENLEHTSTSQDQFTKEASILANLSHPNLPRVTDYFIIPEQGQYLVMDFIEGQDLEEIIENMGPLPVDKSLTWIGQVCKAVEYLHHQPSPVIHRDIKPANIKITPGNQAVLVDFGIAKIFDPLKATIAGAKAVTPGFSPPEQYSGSTDARSDIYSLGATLYTMLTGKTLPESALIAVENDIVSPPSNLRSELNPALDSVILKAIEIRSERRFHRAIDFSAALESAQYSIQPTIQAPGKQVERTVAISQIDAPSIPSIPIPKKEVGRRSKNQALLFAGGALIGLIILGSMLILFGVVVSNRGIVALRTGSPTPINPSSTTATNLDLATSQTIQTSATLTMPQNQPPLPPTEPPPPTAPPTEIPPILNEPAILVLDQNYNCRGGPSSEFEIIWTFQSENELEIIGRGPEPWWLVRIDDSRTRRKQCWIGGGQPTGNIEGVPFSDWTGTVDTAKTPWPN